MNQDDINFPGESVDEERFFSRRNLLKEFTGKTHCPNCKKKYKDKNDKYCRNCWAARDLQSDASFEMMENMMLIYGPPPLTVHYRCGSCGHTWQGSNWSLDRFCPACGSKAENDLPEQEFRHYG